VVCTTDRVLQTGRSMGEKGAVVQRETVTPRTA